MAKDVKDMIFALMMADFDENGLMKVTREARDSIVDSMVDLAKANNRIKSLEADRDILAEDVNFHNCNTCDKACVHRPLPGERVRSNCFMWNQYNVSHKNVIGKATFADGSEEIITEVKAGDGEQE